MIFGRPGLGAPRVALTLAVALLAIAFAAPATAWAQDATEQPATTTEPVPPPPAQPDPVSPTPPPPADAPGVRMRRDVVFSIRNGVRLRLDIGRPARLPGRVLPLVVIVHGGGWWNGHRQDLSRGDDSVQARLTRAGFLTATIDYRLACSADPSQPRRAFGYFFVKPSGPCGAFMRDQVQDVRAAVRHMRRNAGTYRVDPNRVAILGASAGGHLALLAAVNAPADARVRAVVNWSGPTSLSDVRRQNPRQSGTIVASVTNAIGCTWYACRNTWYAFDPETRIANTTRPVRIFAGVSAFERTVHPNSLRRLHMSLQRRLWRTEFQLVSELCHGSGCANRKVFGPGDRTLMDTTVRFLRSSLR